MERIILWCKNTKTGSVSISRNKHMRIDEYDHLKEFILSLFQGSKQISLTDIIEQGYKLQSPTLSKDKIGVLILELKMDLEARGIIKVIYNPDRSQTIELHKRGLKALRRPIL